MKRTIPLFMALALLMFMTSGALAYIDLDYQYGAADPTHQHNWVFDNVDYTGCTSTAYYVYVCSECGDYKVEEKPGPGHDYQTILYQAPTCTENGYASYACSRCGDAYRDVLKALGHDFGEWKTVEAATCVSEAKEERTCSRCGQKETRTVAGYGPHDWGDWKVETPGTCVKVELRYHKCKRCGEVKYQNWGYGDHKWGEWSVVREPSCVAPGLQEQICIYDATHVNQMEIPLDPNGHDWKNGTVETVSEPNCTYPGKQVKHCALDASHTIEVEIPIEETAHDWGEWEVAEPAGPDHAGQEMRVCRINPEHVEFRDLVYDGVIPDVTPPPVPVPDVTVTVAPPDGGQGALLLEIQQVSEVKPYYEAGDEIVFSARLFNTGSVALHGCMVEMDDGVHAEDSVKAYGDLEVGQSVSDNFTVTVTQDSVPTGLISIHWIGFGYLPGTAAVGSGAPSADTAGAVWSNEASADLLVLGLVPPVTPGPIDTSLYLEVTSLNPQPSYDLGDPFEYKATVTNNSSVALYDVLITMSFDSLGFHNSYTYTLQPGESASYTFQEHIISEDLDYAKAHDGQVGLHWSATGYDIEDNEVESNECSDTLTIEKRAEADNPEITITGITEGSAAGKQIGDFVYVTLTVQNTGNVSWTLSNLMIDGTGLANYDFNDFYSYYQQEFDPGESFSFAIGIKIRETDAAPDVMAVRRDFTAACTFKDENDWSNTVSCNIPLQDAVTPPIPDDDVPDLVLTVTCLDPEPFHFDASGHTGDKQYKAAVSNVGQAMCVITDITVTTAAGAFTEPVGPYMLFPADTTPEIPLTYDFSEAELTGEGKLLISFAAQGSAKAGLFSSNEVNLTHEASKEPDIWIPPVETALIVEKYEVSTPLADPNGYVEGEQVVYEIWVYNDSEIAIPTVEIHDPLFGEGIVGTIADLQPFSWDFITMTYTVTAKDVENKQILNRATAAWTDPETGLPQSEDSNLVTVFNAERKPDEAGVSISITYVNPPANHSYYVEGETFPIRVEWKNNTKETLYHVYVRDENAKEMGSGSFLVEDGTLAPGESGSFAYDYVVDDIDVDFYGNVYDIAYIEGVDQYGYTYYAEDEKVAPADRDVPELEKKAASLAVDKKETSHPADGRAYYIEGETITYAITVTNTGSMDLTNVTVADSLSNTFKGAFASITLLHPGESRTYPFSYKVTDQDVGYTKVVNYAIGYFSDGHLSDIPSFSGPVESPTGPQPGPTPPDGPGKTTDGHIDTPIVKDGKDDACVLTLVSRGDGCAEYELHLCSKHAAIYEKAQRQAQTFGYSSSTLATAWQQAATEWKAALDEMYQQILSASSGEARMAVMAERAVFFAYVDSFKAVLNQLNPRQAAIAEQTAAEMLMRQCAELCYVIHFAPEDRPDSLFTGSYKYLALSSSPEKCAISETSDGANLLIREVLCQDHAKVDATAVSLVRQARTRADIADALQRARRAWMAALNDIVNAQYKAASKEDRRLIAACRTLFDSLIEKREALYQFIYPVHPEITQETLMRTVQQDVLLRCK